MTIERLQRRQQIWKPAETGRLKAPQKIATGPSDRVTKKSELSGFQKVAEGKRNTKTLASLENAPGPRSTRPAHLALQRPDVPSQLMWVIVKTGQIHRFGHDASRTLAVERRSNLVGDGRADLTFLARRPPFGFV
ncbi:MAG: hypothetical protein AAFV29_19435 [Myxococcota bacterium]